MYPTPAKPMSVTKTAGGTSEGHGAGTIAEANSAVLKCWTVGVLNVAMSSTSNLFIAVDQRDDDEHQSVRRLLPPIMT